MEKIYKYYAFISYKHADEKWAKWLQKKLETYRLPVALQKQSYPKHVKPIFRDNTDLIPGNLAGKLYENLELSNYLIVICSKNFAKAPRYIDYEIKSFLDMGRNNKIIPFIVDGVPNSPNPEEECFSDFIKSVPGELLGANVQKDGKHIAALKVIAALLQLNADDLIQRDKKRTLIKRITTGISAAFVILLLGTILRLTAQNFEKEAVNAYNYSDNTTAIEASIKSLCVPFGGNFSTDAAQILKNEVFSHELKKSNTDFHKEFEIKAQNRSVGLFAESADKTKVCFTDGSRLFIYNAQNGRFLYTLDVKNSDKDMATFEDCFGMTIDKEAGLFPRGNTVFPAESPDYSEDLTAYYEKDGGNTITVHSKEHNLSFDLTVPDYCTGVSSAEFSPQGRYLFVKAYTKSNGFYNQSYFFVYDLESKSLVLEYEKDADIVFDYNAFSHTDSLQSIYLFSSYKIEKYSYTDRKPDLSNIPCNDTVINCKNTNGDIRLSDDGKKALSIHTMYSLSRSLYNFFDVDTGKSFKTLVFEQFKEIIDVTTDIKYIMYYLDGRITIYDTQNAAVVHEIYCGNTNIVSVAISKDASTAAYLDDNAVLTILKNKNGVYEEIGTLSLDSEYEKSIMFITNDKCAMYTGDGTVLYEIDTAETRYIPDLIWEYPVQLTHMLNTFKALRYVDKSEIIISDDLSKIFCTCDGNHIELPDDLILHPNDYSPVNNLYAGAIYTNQMQFNSEIAVLELVDNQFRLLYKYTSSVPVLELRFDNNGKYIIINGENSCEVIDSMTGKPLFTLDRSITIHNDTIYDISQDLAMPTALPKAQLCSVGKLIAKGRKIVK